MHLIHRGIVNKNYKENLLNSFKTSFKKGYGVETDIHATKDGEFVCFHDFTLKRIHKINKSIKNLSYTEILNLTKKNPIAKDLYTKKYKPKVVRPKKGKGSFKRKKK